MVVGTLVETARRNYVVVGAPEILNLYRERTIKIIRDVRRERKRERSIYTYTIDSREIFERVFVVGHLSSSRACDPIVPHHPTHSEQQL